MEGHPPWVSAMFNAECQFFETSWHKDLLKQEPLRKKWHLPCWYRLEHLSGLAERPPRCVREHCWAWVDSLRQEELLRADCQLSRKSLWEEEGEERLITVHETVSAQNGCAVLPGKTYLEGAQCSGCSGRQGSLTACSSVQPHLSPQA